MALFPSNLGRGMKLLDSKTGTNAITLPNQFDEICVLVAINGNNDYIIDFTIPKGFLSSNSKGFRKGFYISSTSTGNVYFTATTSSVQLSEVRSGSAVVTSNSVITVYYR